MVTRTRQAGGRDEPERGGRWVGVGKYSQDQSSVLRDGTWKAPVHDSYQFTVFFFRDVF
jgi:hypothetical protein